jgi:hypothetical protein
VGNTLLSTLALALAATFLLVVYQLGDSVRAAHDELVSLMVITGFIPHLYIFGSAWKAGKRLSAASGLAITAVAILSSVVPPTVVTNTWLFEGKFDGKDYPVTGDPTTDTRSYMKVNDRTLTFTNKKGDKLTISGRGVVSADGKTRTVTLTGTDSTGKRFTNTAVYDKQ